jgi:hypothetical protein
MGLHETEKHLHNKGNIHQTEETAYKMGENLCQLCTWKEINNQNIQGAQKLTSQRINNQPNKWTNELNRQFSKEEVQTANRHMKKCPTSLAIKEIQVKLHCDCISPPVTIAIISNTNNKCWQGCRGKGTLLHCWWECKLVQLVTGSNMEVPQKN